MSLSPPCMNPPKAAPRTTRVMVSTGFTPVGGGWPGSVGAGLGTLSPQGAQEPPGLAAAGAVSPLASCGFTAQFPAASSLAAGARCYARFVP